MSVKMTFLNCVIILFSLFYFKCNCLPFKQSIDLENESKSFQSEDYNSDQIRQNIENWTDDSDKNIWELSGLFEGDIVIDTDDTNTIAKNGLVNETMRWPFGIIPYYIQSNKFNSSGIAAIEKAIEEFHSKTCLKFKPFNNQTDLNYLVFISSKAGCFSKVGKQNGQQYINLQNPKCVKHGTIVHEILHAVGFYHQQSTYNRDDYVTIHWDNIEEGKEHNFKKYNDDIVTDYDVGYDYGSVMHYSSKAFSKNGNKTITPIKQNIKIGQRNGMSKKDITKLQIMYEDECNAREYMENMDWFPVIIEN